MLYYFQFKASLTQLIKSLIISFRNPNHPEPLSSDIPHWPEFTAESNQFLELNSQEVKVVPTPYKDRLDALRENIDEARKLQLDADVLISKKGI